jgi:methyl-accepting chemotaxis protein
MENNGILISNEQEANKFAAIITSITISLIALIYLLDVARIFIAPLGPMSVAMGLATLFMLVPPFIVFYLKKEGPWVKYVIVTVCTLMVMVMNMLLSWHVVIMFIYPIGMASLYFSRKLSWYAVGISLVLFTVSQIASLYMGGVDDLNLMKPYEMAVYGVAPRSLQLVALSLIFIMLSKRTKKLLQNVVGAEEQKSTLEHIMALTDKSYEVTNTLSDSVKALSEITDHAIKSNEKITRKAGNIVDGSQQTIMYVEEASTIVSSVASNLGVIAGDNKEISKVSQETKVLTDNNTVNMKDAANGMQQIDKATKESRAIILRLGEKSNEIANIAQVIKSIATRTNLLSLNASIESARAGEQGKGFAVVASEIRALAEQSQTAASSIEALIQKVLEDTTEAVDSMDVNAKLVENGMTLIDKADKSSGEVTKSIEKVNTMAQNIAALSTTVAENGEKINNAVEGISKLTVESMKE